MSGSKTSASSSGVINPETTSLKNPITYYKTKTSLYPSNAQAWWTMLRPPELGNAKAPKQYLEVFDPALRHQIKTGDNPAAKGYYILKAFQKDRSAASGVAGLDTETSQGQRPEAVAFYAGRVFYGGVQASGFNTDILFTQIIERPEQVSACYQQQDPTSQDLRDLLPSDGGVIAIPEAVRIFHMTTLGKQLYAFSSNGVWSIGGGASMSFAANDYSVTKVSGTPTISNMSFVDVEGVPIWWNKAGVNSVVTSEDGLSSHVISLTDETIKTFYQSIPEQSKYYAKGAYDSLTKTVQFLYRSTETSVEADLYKYDKVLVLDTETGAWYPWSLPDTRVQIVGLFGLQGDTTTATIGGVVSGVDNVVAGSDEVVVNTTATKVIPSQFKYVCHITSGAGPFLSTGITFAEGGKNSYLDWSSVLSDGLGFESYFIGGYGVYGEGNKKFQNNYITLNYRNVSGGGAYVQGLWDYTTDDTNGLWSTKQYVYSGQEGQDHGTRKLKIRGGGKALQIRISSEGEKPFEINGWASLITSNAAV